VRIVSGAVCAFAQPVPIHTATQSVLVVMADVMSTRRSTRIRRDLARRVSTLVEPDRQVRARLDDG
jgi:hypothetical protein